MNRMLYNKLASMYFWLFSFNALSTAVTTALLNTEWQNLSGTSKFLTVFLIGQSWSNTMLAFINKSASRVAEDKPILSTDTGNTTIITREQTSEKTTEKTTA